MKSFTKNAALLFLLLFATNIHAASQQVSESKGSSTSTDLSHFHSAAIKYIPIFESYILNEAPSKQISKRLETFSIRFMNEGENKELAADLLEFTNAMNARLASQVGLSVFDLPEFLGFFHNNIDEYITPDSPIYETLQNNRISIMPVERIRVVCNGLHCNNPSSSILQGWIVLAFISNGIGATQSSDVRVVSDQGGEYSNTSGIWRNNGFADIELVSVRPCETCKLN